MSRSVSAISQIESAKQRLLSGGGGNTHTHIICKHTYIVALFVAVNCRIRIYIGESVVAQRCAGVSFIALASISLALSANKGTPPPIPLLYLNKINLRERG